EVKDKDCYHLQREECPRELKKVQNEASNALSVMHQIKTANSKINTTMGSNKSETELTDKAIVSSIILNFEPFFLNNKTEFKKKRTNTDKIINLFIEETCDELLSPKRKRLVRKELFEIVKKFMK
ncbi:hypothetical protein Mgra_00006934, partial [Meloidogyne graminicola]